MAQYIWIKDDALRRGIIKKADLRVTNLTEEERGWVQGSPTPGKLEVFISAKDLRSVLRKNRSRQVGPPNNDHCGDK